MTPSDGASSEGYAGGVAHSEMEPSAEAEQGETLDAVTAYDALRSVQQDYDALLDRGSSDCPEAERLVQRICYLAERVCGLEGVDGAAARRDPNDPNALDPNDRSAIVSPPPAESPASTRRFGSTPSATRPARPAMARAIIP